MKKKIPTFKSDRAAAAFVDRADLAQYDLTGATLTRFEIKPKGKSINLRLSGELYDAVRWDPLESTCRHASLSIL